MADGRNLIKRLGLGVAAGFVGTLGLQVLETASARWLPNTMAPYLRDPGELMVEKLEAFLPVEARARVPAHMETTIAKLVALGYGLTTAAIYAALRPRAGDVFVDGVTFGLSTWAVGYLGWIPALGFMPPISRWGLGQAIGPAVRHVGFGVMTVATYRRLQDRM